MKILAVDYGDSRTGLAVCDPGEILATPLRPQIEEKAMAKVAAQVCAAAREHGAGLIVIGLPRQTTITAAGFLSESGTFGKKRKAILDAVSASVILENYLAWRKSHPGQE